MKHALQSNWAGRPFSWNRLYRTFLVTFPHCVQTESTQHLHCRVFRVMVMLLLLLFFTQSKGGKSIKRCVHGISCWGDDLSIVMKKSGIPKSPKPDGGTKKFCETQPWKMKPESEPYTWILITFVYTKNSTFMIPKPEFCCPTTSLDLSLGEGER